ncbi:MAG: DUF1015 domain-containing protein [Clostridia bacterium]|nr:DUF1015 domain-containing protein [Clostridia bacterium]
MTNNSLKCYSPADILLPDMNKTNAKKWAVIACDQFTSEPEYWEKVKRTVGDAPSTLRITLPEVYLDEAQERIPSINATMKDYIRDVLVAHENAEIFVERVQSDGSVRRGILLSVDLECYDYRKGASSLIRATEATVVERIPPRVAIRRNAEVELPHVMLLIDDPERTVIEPLINDCDGEVAYDTELMLGGGRIKGRFLSEKNIAHVSEALDRLVSPEKMGERYGDVSLSPLLFAVGDGNHSLATAKALYEETKAKLGEDAAKNHPARYALVEIVNIHDEALKFEPIYRVMFGVEPKDVIEALNGYISALDGNAEPQTLTYLYGETVGCLEVKTPVRQLPVATLQEFIDGYLESHSGASVDYIHGEESVKALAAKENAIGFIFTGMGKSELFKTVIFDGALPRKTFSMGHAEDKRYYFECRKITL